MAFFRKIALLFALLAVGMPSSARALPQEALDSVVSVLPVWPGKPQGGTGAPAGSAPEGSGIVVRADGFIATAWHVVELASRIDVRLRDGRILPARLIGHDAASDIALLTVDEPLAAFEVAERPALAERVCAIGNAFGLGLSVSCGVVSAHDVSNAGFNAVEDFVQTDAAVNPGSSGGALVDDKGALVGMVSAIFASGGETNIGINFAVSARLLLRVADDLRRDGKVDYVSAGWKLEPLTLDERRRISGVRIGEIAPDGAAAAAGVLAGDIVTRISGRRIGAPRDAIAALALATREKGVSVQLMRDAQMREIALSFAKSGPSATASPAPSANPPANSSGIARPDCPYSEAVCLTRQAVFPVESFDPVASAVRIGPDLLVTNRHVVGDRKKATVLTPSGPLEAVVVPSSYRGDLALLRVEGLPADGFVLKPEDGQTNDFAARTYFAVGADLARQEIRVFEPGSLILPPAKGATFGRLHVTARMQPGVSGGALVNERGELSGIAVGGGEGRYEALPVVQITRLLQGAKEESAASVQEMLGAAFVRCMAALDAARAAPRGEPYAEDMVYALRDNCRASENPGQLLEAGRLLSLGRANDAAIGLHEEAVERVPNSVNARVSLLVSLQLGGRFSDMLPHARWLLGVIPDDPQALRFAIQSGVWGDDRKLAEAAYAKLLETDPRQAQAARRFIDQAPPAPPRR